MATEFAGRVSLLGLVTVVAGAGAFVHSPPPSVVSFFGVLGVGYGFGALTAGLYAYLGVKIPAPSPTPEADVAGGRVPATSEDGIGADDSDVHGSPAGASDGGFVYAAETSLVSGEEKSAVDVDDDSIDAGRADVPRADAGATGDGAGTSDDVGGGPGDGDGGSPEGANQSAVEAEQHGDGGGRFTFFIDAGSEVAGDEPVADESAEEETTDEETSWDVDEDPDTDDPGAASAGERDDGDADGEETFVLGDDEFVVEGPTER